MKELLENFSIPQIIMFIVLLAVAFKKISDFLDWLKEKTSKREKEVIDDYAVKQDTAKEIEEIKKNQANMAESIDNLSDQIHILLESDKDDIKAWITREHHYFCYQKGWIDDYSLDCLERRYEHYKEENGNSFVSELVNEVRALPKQPPQE